MSDKEKTPETSHSSDRTYRVQMRSTGIPIMSLSGNHIGHEWMRLPEIEAGPNGTAYNDTKDTLTRTHDYYGAVALATSFLSGMYVHHIRGCCDLEIRIIEYEREVSYKLTEREIKPLPNHMDDLFSRAGLADRVKAAEKKK